MIEEKKDDTQTTGDNVTEIQEENASSNTKELETPVKKEKINISDEELDKETIAEHPSILQRIRIGLPQLIRIARGIFIGLIEFVGEAARAFFLNSGERASLLDAMANSINREGRNDRVSNRKATPPEKVEEEPSRQENKEMTEEQMLEEDAKQKAPNFKLRKVYEQEIWKLSKEQQGIVSKKFTQKAQDVLHANGLHAIFGEDSDQIGLVDKNKKIIATMNKEDMVKFKPHMLCSAFYRKDKSTGEFAKLRAAIKSTCIMAMAAAANGQYITPLAQLRYNSLIRPINVEILPRETQNDFEIRVNGKELGSFQAENLDAEMITKEIDDKLKQFYQCEIKQEKYTLGEIQDKNNLTVSVVQSMNEENKKNISLVWKNGNKTGHELIIAHDGLSTKKEITEAIQTMKQNGFEYADTKVLAIALAANPKMKLSCNTSFNTEICVEKGKISWNPVTIHHSSVTVMDNDWRHSKIVPDALKNKIKGDIKEGQVHQYYDTQKSQLFSLSVDEDTKKIQMTQASVSIGEKQESPLNNTDRLAISLNAFNNQTIDATALNINISKDFFSYKAKSKISPDEINRSCIVAEMNGGMEFKASATDLDEQQGDTINDDNYVKMAATQYGYSEEDDEPAEYIDYGNVEYSVD